MTGLPMAAEPEKPDDAWIDKVVKVTSALGMNPTRTRWKLIRWQEKRRQAARRREQQVDHIRYQHKTCDACGAVNDREATACSRCEAKLGGHALQVARRIGLVPRAVSVSMLLALAMLAVYVRVLVAAGGGIGSPSAPLLYDFGGQWPPVMPDDAWRWLTAIFLHAGLWHLAFNLIAIAMIGPRIEELYGRGTMLFLIIATGVVAGIGSWATGLAGVGIGASGGVMGLIGVAGAYGHRLGTPAGRALRNDMLRWTAYTIVFGFFVNADNRAHIVGALAGALFGFAVAPRHWNAPRWKVLRILVTIVGALAMAGALAIIFTRTPSPDDAPARRVATYEPYAEICRKHFAGDAAAARTAYDAIVGDLGASVPERNADGSYTYRRATAAEIYGTADPVGNLCESMLQLRRWCRSGEAASLATSADRKLIDDSCPHIEAAFGAFPQEPKLLR